MGANGSHSQGCESFISACVANPVLTNLVKIVPPKACLEA